jgi:glycosyltransferase involved in cell wall biosynthesis
MKKRLIIVIWNMGIGGIQKRMRDIALDIARNKKAWEVIFLIRRKGVSPFVQPLVGRKNIRLVYYPHQGVHFPLGFIVWTAIKYAQLKPDVVLTFLAQLTIVMVLIKKIIFQHKARLVVNEGAFVSGYLRFNNMNYLHGLLSWAYSFVDFLIGPTYACKKDLSEAFGVDTQRIAVVPNWTLLRPSRPRQAVFDGLFVGRFEREKNPLAMVELAELLRIYSPSIRLVMVGDGSMERQILEQIKQKNLASILQVLPPNEAPEALRKTRLLLVPSLNEGMPNVVLEAAMCRVPTIANNFQGADEVIVDTKTGFIVDNVKEMEQKVRDLLANSRKREQMGGQAQKHVQRNFAMNNQKRFIELLLKD